MGDIKVEIYRDILLQIKRGNHKGKTINAKPLFLVTIIELIDNGTITSNRFPFDELLSKAFDAVQLKYNQQPSPLYYPFYYLTTQKIWHHKYRLDSTKKTQCPSAKFIRENIEYAYLDNALWDLLQNPDTRNYLKEKIINAYLQ